VLPRLRAQTLQETNAPLALQSLWALYVSGGFDDAIASTLLRHTSAPVRGWTVRLLADAKNIAPELRQEVVALARNEHSASVRSQLACSAKRLPVNDALPIIHELLHHDEDLNDPHIPLLIWWAIEDKVAAHPNDVMTLLSSAANWNDLMMRRHILERVARRFAAETNGSTRPQCAWLLRTALTSEQRDAVLSGFDKAWEGQRATTGANDTLAQSLARLWNTEQVHSGLMLRVALRLGSGDAQQVALERLTNSTVKETERIELAKVMGECGLTSAVPSLVQLLRTTPKLQVSAIAALQNFSDHSVATSILDAYSRLSAGAKTRARSALASRPAWALELIRGVERGVVPAKDVAPDVLRQMVAHNNAELTAAIEKRWGKLQAKSSEEKLSTINRLKLVLNPSGTTHRFKGDAVKGKDLFTKTCATCHKLFGEGNSIGPDLTGADRKNTDWLLSQIVDPSAFIRPEFVNHNVEMKDDRSLSGLIAEQSDSAITLLDAQNQRTVLNRAEVKEIRASSTSLMPEGLLEALEPQQVRDLFSYLQQ
jgi:putative heme-binding domain-containing protein